MGELDQWQGAYSWTAHLAQQLLQHCGYSALNPLINHHSQTPPNLPAPPLASIQATFERYLSYTRQQPYTAASQVPQHTLHLVQTHLTHITEGGHTGHFDNIDNQFDSPTGHFDNSTHNLGSHFDNSTHNLASHFDNSTHNLASHFDYPSRHFDNTDNNLGNPARHLENADNHHSGLRYSHFEQFTTSQVEDMDVTMEDESEVTGHGLGQHDSYVSSPHLSGSYTVPNSPQHSPQPSHQYPLQTPSLEAIVHSNYRMAASQRELHADSGSRPVSGTSGQRDYLPGAPQSYHALSNLAAPNHAHHIRGGLNSAQDGAVFVSVRDEERAEEMRGNGVSPDSDRIRVTGDLIENLGDWESPADMSDGHSHATNNDPPLNLDQPPHPEIIHQRFHFLCQRTLQSAIFTTAVNGNSATPPSSPASSIHPGNTRADLVHVFSTLLCNFYFEVYLWIYLNVLLHPRSYMTRNRLKFLCYLSNQTLEQVTLNVLLGYFSGFHQGRSALMLEITNVLREVAQLGIDPNSSNSSRSGGTVRHDHTARLRELSVELGIHLNPRQMLRSFSAVVRDVVMRRVPIPILVPHPW